MWNFYSGENPSQKEKDNHSNELFVTQKTSPTFIIHNQDDDLYLNSLLFFNALSYKKVGVCDCSLWFHILYFFIITHIYSVFKLVVLKHVYIL